jgi:hypothetical protein
MTSVVHAEIVSIPGAAFSVANPQVVTLNGFPTLVNGVLDVAGNAQLVAPDDFLKNGQLICKMTVVYVDSSNEDLRVQLVKKSAVTGTNSTTPPALLAEVMSNGSVLDVTRRSSTKAITPRKINDRNGFYYLQTAFVNANLDIIGVMLDVRSSCP